MSHLVENLEQKKKYVRPAIKLIELVRGQVEGNQVTLHLSGGVTCVFDPTTGGTCPPTP